MRDHFRLGRIASMTLLLVEGVLTIIHCLTTNSMSWSMNLFSLCWLICFILLHFVRTDTEHRRLNYFVLQNTILSVLSAWRANELHRPNLLFVTLLCIWLINIVYLNKKVYRILVVENVLIFAIFTFAGRISAMVAPESTLVADHLFISFEIREFFNMCVAMFLGMWIGSVVSDDYQFLLRMQQEHNAGMDELFELVIDKFKDAKIANAAKSNFLANMSHEIRTPINAVLGLDTMILRETKEKNIKAYAMDINSAGQSLLSVINDILDLSKIESGKMEIVPVEYDVSSLINDVVNMIQVKTEQKGLDFILEVNEKLPSKLYGDDVRIRQVLINILTNAAKYTNEGSVTLGVDFSQTENSDEIMLHCQVKDTGIGIKEEDIEKLYSKYVRIEAARNRNVEGTGLGVNIITSFLSMMGSELQVTSVYGEGSNFFFDLKQKVVNPEPIGNLADRISQQAINYEYEAPFIAPDARILVVDDNAMNRLVFMGLIKNLKMTIDEAESGFECLRLVSENKYDIIFMDHMMPEMDGIETFQHIKEDKGGLNYRTPVVILTANAIVGAKEMYLEKGFRQYLSKPVVPERLEECIRELIPAEKKVAVEESDNSADNEKESIDLSREFPPIEGMDWAYGYMHLKDVELLRATVTNFVGMIDSEADYLMDCYRKIMEGDTSATDAFRIKVHAMKSSATLIGAFPIAGMAASLEYASRDGNLEFVKNVAPHFIDEWKKYKDKLKVFLPEDEGSKKTYNSPEEIVDYFEKLNSLMECFDVDGADEALAQIKEYEYPEEAKAVLEKISGAVMNLDADATKELTEEFMEIIRR